MASMPSLFKKNNEILPPKIKQVMVTLSYRQPVIKKVSFKPDKPKKETRSINEIKKIKIKPKPKKAIIFTPKKKPSTLLKKKDLAKPEKKIKQNKPVIQKQKEVIKEKPTPVKVKVVEAGQSKAVKKQNFEGQPATLKKITPPKKENIKQQKAHIEFAKPLYKENVLPAYPVIAKRRGYQGIVELMVLVSENGKVSSLKIFKSSGYKSLDRQAVITVKNWLFEPGKRNGIPEEMWVKIPVKFELK